MSYASLLREPGSRIDPMRPEPPRLNISNVKKTISRSIALVSFSKNHLFPVAVTLVAIGCSTSQGRAVDAAPCR